MKKSILLVSVCLLIVFALTVPAAASDYVEVFGYFEASAEKNEEILDGEAGEATTEWYVPLLSKEPIIDGIISKGEYAPFEDYEDYLSLVATTNIGAENFEALMEKTKDGIFDAYWGWDGQYLYLAFDVYCVNGYNCSLDQDIMLFAYNCLQVGLAPTDAQAKDPDYLEMGFGYDHIEDRDITITWSGQYQSARDDFVGSYDEQTQHVIYELRIDLMKAMQLEEYPVAGYQCNYAFVLEIGGEDDVNYMTDILFCHGIGGQYSMKMCEYFACITFSDQVYFAPETTEPETTEPETTEQFQTEIWTNEPITEPVLVDTTAPSWPSEEETMIAIEQGTLPSDQEDRGGLVYELFEAGVLSDCRGIVNPCAGGLIMLALLAVGFVCGKKK